MPFTLRVGDEAGDDATVRIPYSDTDPRVAAIFPSPTCGVVVLFFESLADDAPLIGVQVGASEEPWTELDPVAVRKTMSQLPQYVKVAHALIQWDREDIRDSLRELRQEGNRRRGLSTTFLRNIAVEYSDRVAAGETAPIQTIADRHGVNKSTAWRWVSAARSLGFLHSDRKGSK